MKITDGRRSFFLNSTDDPRGEARRWADKQVGDAESVLLLGTDFLYPVRALLDMPGVETIFLVDYWQELVDITLEYSPHQSVLEESAVRTLFGQPITELVEEFRQPGVKTDEVRILQSP